MGTAYAQNDKWTIIHIHDLEPLYNNYSKLKAQYKIITQSLNADFSKEYHNYIITIDYSIKNIDETFYRIFPEVNRSKRGLINGLGSVFKSITGNLDAEDGEKIYKALNMLEDDQNSIHKLLDEQTSLMIEAITEINNTVAALAHNQEQITDHIKTLQYVIRSLVTNQLSAFHRVYLLELFTQIGILLNDVQSIILTTENAVTFAKLKTYHTSILKPNFISKELRIIKDHISNSKLITTNDIILYEKVFKIKATQNKFKIIFIIEIPLVEVSDYSYYQLYSVPIQSSQENFHIILPQTRYLILNEQRYASRDEQCEELRNQLYLCKDDNPTEINKSSPCEIKLITFQKPIDNCIQEPVRISEAAVSKYGNTQYVIIAPKQTKAILKCPDHENTRVLEGTFMATLKPRCFLSIDGKTYTADQTSTETQQSFNVPLLEVTPRKPVMSTQDQDLPTLRLENVPLHNLDNIKAQLQAEKQRIPKDIKIPIYRTSIWTIIIYTGVILAILYEVIRRMKHRKTTKPEKKTTTEIPLKIVKP